MGSDPWGEKTGVSSSPRCRPGSKGQTVGVSGKVGVPDPRPRPLSPSPALGISRVSCLPYGLTVHRPAVSGSCDVSPRVGDDVVEMCPLVGAWGRRRPREALRGRIPSVKCR